MERATGCTPVALSCMAANSEIIPHPSTHGDHDRIPSSFAFFKAWGRL